MILTGRGRRLTLNNIWYFTFGVEHPYADYVQPIIGDYDAARDKMFQLHGHAWCSQRRQDELDMINLGRDLLGLPPYQFLPEVQADV